MSVNGNNCSIINYFFWFSAIYVLCKILNKLWTLTDQYILPNFREPIDFKRYGQWAVITGSTDGIGKGFAEELASKGLDICLISRNKDKLRNTAKHIEERYCVKTKYIVADFTDSNVYTHIKESLNDLDVGVLVNNVGMIHEGGEPFNSHSEIMIKNYINVNILSTMMMSSIILSLMIPKKKGLIVNISSMTGELDVAYAAVYSSSKLCITKFGTSLSYELKKHNIEVKTLTPGYVSTNMGHLYPNAVKFCSILPFDPMPTVMKYVKSSINKSLNSKSIQNCGYIIHEIFLIISKLLPAALILRVTESIYYNKNVNK